MTGENIYDALVVGTGFGGINQLYHLAKLGLTAKAIDKASGPGGTWHWNRYPGAMSDTEAFVYRFSFDRDSLRTYPNRYVSQEEVLDYLEYIIDRYDLRKYMQFNTDFLGAEYDEALNGWRAETSSGMYTARYLFTAVGLLSNEHWPAIPGRNEFRGQAFHSASIPAGYSFEGKKVGVIGTGSTGVQLITALAPEVQHLTCFQRRPQYIVPLGNRPITKETRENIDKNYEQIWNQVRGSFSGMGFEEATTSALDVTDEERERRHRHQRGGQSHRERVHPEEINQIVADPKTAQKLQPTELYARRPVCAPGYYETFNRENVTLVDLKTTPFLEFTADGIRTGDGVEHELDVVVCGTGFQAVDGSYSNLNIRGSGGQTLKEHWEGDPSTYLGCAVAGFPNLFLVNGPKTAFANVIAAIEAGGEFTTGLIAEAEELRRSNGCDKKVVIEVTEDAERKWCEICKNTMVPILLTKCDAWIFGTNVQGRKHTVLFYWGGLSSFRGFLKRETGGGFQGFRPFLR